MQRKHSLFEKKLKKYLSPELQNIFPKPLWENISEYLFLFSSLICPVSGELFWAPVSLRHPKARDLFFSYRALEKAAAQHQLLELGITPDNLGFTISYFVDLPHFIHFLLNSENHYQLPLNDPQQKHPELFKFLKEPELNKINLFHELKIAIARAKKRNCDHLNLVDFMKDFDYPLQTRDKSEPVELLKYTYPSVALHFLAEIYRKGLADSFISLPPSLIPIVLTIIKIENIIEKLQFLSARGLSSIGFTRSPNEKFSYLRKVLNFLSLLDASMRFYFELRFFVTKFDSKLDLTINVVWSLFDKLFTLTFNAATTDKLLLEVERIKRMIPLSLLSVSFCLLTTGIFSSGCYGIYGRQLNQPLYPDVLTMMALHSITTLPGNILASHETAEEFKSIVHNPRQLLETVRDSQGFTENRLTTFSRRAKRFFYSCAVSLLFYVSTEDPAMALLLFLATFNLGSIRNHDHWSPQFFQLPLQESPRGGEPALVNRNRY